MKSRSAFEICLPGAVLIVAGLLSTPTLILAMLWMFAGAVAVGHRDVRTFPREGIPVRWHWGWRSSILSIYHLAWWPWYMRQEIAQFVTQMRQRIQGHPTPRADDSPRKTRKRDKD
jgi:hypothetical protein